MEAGTKLEVETKFEVVILNRFERWNKVGNKLEVRKQLQFGTKLEVGMNVEAGAKLEIGTKLEDVSGN